MRIFKVPSVGIKLFSQILWKNHKPTNEIFLTFDDGPDPNFTPRILNFLQDENARATFFVIGKKVQQYPSLITQIHERGHTIGLHSYHHNCLLFKSKPLLFKQISNSRLALETIIQQPPLYFRPPYGAFSPQLLQICQQLNLQVVIWSIMSYDFDRKLPDDMILKIIQTRVADRDIIVFHDGHANSSRTVRILPSVIKILKEKGFNLSALAK